MSNSHGVGARSRSGTARIPLRRGLHVGTILLGVLMIGMLGAGPRVYAQSGSQEGASEAVRDSTVLASGEAATRAGRWRQKRRRKARQMQRPEPGFWQRVGQFVRQTSGSVVPHQLILEVPKLEVAGFHPVLGGLGDDAGLVGGVLYEPPFFRRGDRLASLEVLGSLRRYYGTEALLGFESERYVGQLYGRYQHRPMEEFYGIGRESEEENESVYRLNETVVGGLFGHSLGDHALLGGHVSYRLDRYGVGRGRQPQVRRQFGDALPGVGADLNTVMVGGFFEIDLRDTAYERSFGHRFTPVENRLRSVSLDASRGFYLATEITQHVETRLHEFSFTRYTIDVREFLPIDEGLLHGFAFRQFASFTDTPNENVPFYRLQTIGGSRSLRGYSTGRFRDRNILLANTEVRCQIWHWLDMALFVDAGHAFRAFEEVPLADPHLGYGVGFRVQKDDKTLARLDFAWSEEGFSPHIDLGSLF